MCPSPNQVNQHPTMVYAIRFGIVEFYDRGVVAYDLYETMNRIEWGIQHNMYDIFGGAHNVGMLQRIRYGDIADQDAIFQDMGGGLWTSTGFKQFMRVYGVETDMNDYDEETFGMQMAQAADAAEALLAAMEGTAALPIVITEDGDDLSDISEV